MGYHKLIPASYLLFVKDEKVLLLKRANTGFEDGKYSLVSGHVEKGETFTQAAIREAEEEAGVKINESDLKLVHMMQRNSSVKENERIDAFFIVNKWIGEIKNMEPHKCDDLSWFELNDLPENVIDYVKEVLIKISNKEFYSEFN